MATALVYFAVTAFVCLSLWTLLFSSSLSRDDLRQYGFESVTLPGGLTLNYRVRGDPHKPAIMLVHGGGDSLSAWDGWCEVLESDFRLIAVDLPGHGLSGPYPDAAYSTQTLAVSLKAFIDAIGLEDFAIAGHSFGGETVLRYVVDNPHDPKAMVLVAPGGYKAEHGLAVPPTIARCALSPAGRLILRNFWSRPLFSVFQHKNFFFRKSSVSRAAINRQFALLRYAPNRGAMLSLVMNDMANHEDIKGLGSLQLPSLFLWGRQDRIVPLDTGRRIAADVPDSKLLLFDEMGHMLHVERAAESARAAKSFLQSLPSFSERKGSPSVQSPSAG